MAYAETVAVSSFPALSKDTDSIAAVSPSGNPSDTITRANNTNAIHALDVVSTAAGEILEFATGLPVGSKFIIYSAQMSSTESAVPSGMTTFRLHLYDTSPTAIADTAAMNVPAADAAKYLGYITLSALEDRVDTLSKRTDSINAVMALAAANATLYGILETVGAFTPVASIVYTIKLYMGAL